MYCICFTQNWDNEYHKIGSQLSKYVDCRGPDNSVLLIVHNVQK